MKFKTRTRKIAYHIEEICIDDHWFGIDDLIETLEEVKRDSIAITNENMAKALKKRKVLSHVGSRRAGTGAWVGPNYDKFLTRMKDYRTELCEQVQDIGISMCQDEAAPSER